MWRGAWFPRCLALSSGGEGLGFGNDGDCTESPWSSCLSGIGSHLSEGGDPINQLKMDPTPILNSGLGALEGGVPAKKTPKGAITGRRRISEVLRWAGRGSACSFSRTTLTDSRLGGVGRLAVTVTQVSVGSQGQPAGRSPDRQTGQPTAAFTSAVLSPGNAGGSSLAVLTSGG